MAKETPRVRAAEVAQRCKLSEEANQLLRDDMNPRQFLEQLLQEKRYADAVQFLAHALPKREAVWWACQCIRQGSELSPAQAQAVRAAEQWAADPSEGHRRAAYPAAEAAEFGTPGGCVAVAAFWSGGSISLPDLPEVLPAENLTGDTVANAVLMAVGTNDPEKAQEKYQTFFALGNQVAIGANRWK
jgi:hypothetical protein